MKAYKYANNVFYPYALEQDYRAAGTWPENGIDVSDAIYSEFSGETPPGKMRITDEDGMPAWSDIPPLSTEQLVSIVEQQRQVLRAKADAEIAWRQDAFDAGITTDQEVSELTAWKKYRVLLMRLDSSKAPEITWPEPPFR
ncbi:tail fiber assembly protein [Enterobacter sp.]|uniref:tail fiber assembly protein n=1 Tax=Enterobacter sp. TaxID=42895 RepID=UPI00296E67EB|nr:tail fiber assembly protein [Enterobacter sp.]